LNVSLVTVTAASWWLFLPFLMSSTPTTLFKSGHGAL
jgi:hypothetical protein